MVLHITELSTNQVPPLKLVNYVAYNLTQKQTKLMRLVSLNSLQAADSKRVHCNARLPLWVG